VTLVGHRENVQDWVAASNVVALPSRWEGLSLAMLQAMARGRSVVSTDVGGAREVIGESAGSVVNGDPNGFARALIERFLDPVRADREGRCGRRIVETSHDARATADAIADSYGELLRRRSARPSNARPRRARVQTCEEYATPS